MPTAPSPSEDTSQAAVEVRSLAKNYGKVEALKGIDLTVGKGEMFALLGPNGAGKTTLFSILATLRAPTAGAARVFGLDVVADRDAIRREMGIVFQEPAIEQRLSGRDNLMLMGLLYGHPRILFLDEATLGLDVDARRTFWGQIRGLADEGRTVFFTTHYMEEAEVADRIALIDSGRIVALGTPSELKARVGGGVVTLRTENDERAREWLRGRGFVPEAGGQAITLVHADPAAIIPDLLRNLPVRVDRAEVHAPSLEDVFLKLTGRGLEGGGGKP
jgi:ABC-2 type transport system ATP-binding protein